MWGGGEARKRGKDGVTAPIQQRHVALTLLRLFGVSAKHFKLLVSTTVSQNDTTGSATLTSTSEGGGARHQ